MEQDCKAKGVYQRIDLLDVGYRVIPIVRWKVLRNGALLIGSFDHHSKSRRGVIFSYGREVVGGIAVASLRFRQFINVQTTHEIALKTSNTVARKYISTDNVYWLNVLIPLM
jgi:hypothetical protein